MIEEEFCEFEEVFDVDFFNIIFGDLGVFEIFIVDDYIIFEEF